MRDLQGMKTQQQQKKKVMQVKTINKICHGALSVIESHLRKKVTISNRNLG